ncbi:MAG: FkbM family methyltransferase [Pseudomonadota bacterium]
MTIKENVTAEAERLKRRTARNLRNAHAKGLMQGILSMLKPGDIVFDCGANVGDITMLLAQTGAEVHAFEPDPYAYDKLSTRFDGKANVFTYNAALGVQAGQTKLMRAVNFDQNPKGGSVKSTVVSGGRNINEDLSQGFDVELISLTDRLIDMKKEGLEVAFLKMDIEGAELEILEAMHAKKLFDTIRLTVAETHEHKFKALRPRFKKLRKSISEVYPITKVNLDWI